MVSRRSGTTTSKKSTCHLVAVLRDRVNNEHAGAVVSFPTVYVFTPEILGEASKLGVTPPLLWGTREHCLKAAEPRASRSRTAT